MAKRMLADVLWQAANRHLSEDSTWSYEGKRDYYSCGAVEFAVGGKWHPASAARDFLRALGCPVDSALQFQEFRNEEQRQGVRYMWLLLAMHIAEDEGIEIEVEA